VNATYSASASGHKWNLALANTPVQIEVWLLAAHPYQDDTGSVTSVSIDGTNLILTSTATSDTLTTDGGAQLSPGTHHALFTLSQAADPVITFGGNVSSVI